MTLTYKEMDDIIQDHFTILDKVSLKHDSVSECVLNFSTHDRVLYYVNDIYGVTMNAGMENWVHYHHDKADWINEGQLAFYTIGFPNVSKSLGSCLDKYYWNGKSLEGVDFSQMSRSIWDKEEEIIVSLYRYLMTNKFTFSKPD